MLTSLKRLLANFVAGVNLVFLLLLLGCVLSSYLPPESFPRLALSGLAFPVLLVVNLLFLPFWLIFQVRFVWLPLVGLLLCSPFIRDYFPLNVPSEPPAGTIKVLSYNTAGLGSWDKASNGPQHVIDYLVNSGADIICLQEACRPSNTWRGKLDKAMKEAGYHVGVVEGERWDVQPCYSKYPILSAEILPYVSKYNGSVKYRILAGRDTLVLVNNHLESYKLTADDKAHYKGIIREPDQPAAEQNARMLINKMADAVKLRGPQVDSLLVQLAPTNHLPTILCGDFNDPPITYTYRRFAGVYANAFEHSGNGAGFSFYQRGFNVRIDHVFYSRHWRSYHTDIDRNITCSDHYPIVTYLERVSK